LYTVFTNLIPQLNSHLKLYNGNVQIPRGVNQVEVYTVLVEVTGQGAHTPRSEKRRARLVDNWQFSVNQHCVIQ